MMAIFQSMNLISEMLAHLGLRPNVRTPSGDKNDLMFVINASKDEREGFSHCVKHFSSVKKVSLYIPPHCMISIENGCLMTLIVLVQFSGFMQISCK